MMRRIAALVLILAVSACATVEPRPPADTASRYFLSLTPESLGRNLSLSQLVTGEHDGNTYRVRYEVEIVGDRLTIIGLSPLGITLFVLVQNGETITVDSRLKGAAGFDPRYTLFDLYVTYWPANIVGAALDKNGMTLHEDPRNGSRTVRGPDGRKVVTVTYPAAKNPGARPGAVTEIEHFDLPYRLRIMPIPAPDGT